MKGYFLGESVRHRQNQLPFPYIIVIFRVHHRALALNVFSNWHAAFHGTRVDSVKAILECRDLLIPGMSLGAQMQSPHG